MIGCLACQSNGLMCGPWPMKAAIYLATRDYRRPDPIKYSGVFPRVCFLFLKVFPFLLWMTRRPRPPAGARGSLSRGLHRGLCVSGELHTLPGQLPLLVLSSWTKRRHTSAVVRGGSSRESLSQPHSWPRAQPTITPLHGAQAWAHRWRRARAHGEQRAIAWESDRADDHPGARACDVRPGVRAGYRACHGGECHGQRERGGKLHLLHHVWGWATLSGLLYGDICRHAPSSPAFIWTLSVLNCLPILSSLPVQKRPRMSFPCLALGNRLSTTTCSSAFGWPPGVVSPSSTMAPPSVGSTVGHRHDRGLGPTWLLLLLQFPSVVTLAPPVFSLDTSSIITTLDSVVRPPPGHPTTAWTSSILFMQTFCHPSVFSSLLHIAPSGRGGENVTLHGLLGVGFHFLPRVSWPSFCLPLIVLLCSGVSSP